MALATDPEQHGAFYRGDGADEYTMLPTDRWCEEGMMSSLQDEDFDLEPADRRRTLARLPRQRRPGRVGAHCDRCEEDLEVPDNQLGHELVVDFESRHTGHERRAASAPTG